MDGFGCPPRRFPSRFDTREECGRRSATYEASPFRDPTSGRCVLVQRTRQHLDDETFPRRCTADRVRPGGLRACGLSFARPARLASSARSSTCAVQPATRPSYPRPRSTQIADRGATKSPASRADNERTCRPRSSAATTPWNRDGAIAGSFGVGELVDAPGVAYRRYVDFRTLHAHPLQRQHLTASRRSRSN